MFSGPRNFPVFVEPGSSLFCLQELAAGPCPWPHRQILFLQVSFRCYPLDVTLGREFLSTCRFCLHATSCFRGSDGAPRVAVVEQRYQVAFSLKVETSPRCVRSARDLRVCTAQPRTAHGLSIAHTGVSRLYLLLVGTFCACGIDVFHLSSCSYNRD